MRISTANGVVAAAMLCASTSTLFAQGVVMQTADVIGQSPAGPIVAQGGATVIRDNNSVFLSLTMPTPEPGSYDYPPANPFQPIDAAPGTPEVFTGWAFIFNEPENCAVPNQCVPPPPGAPAPNDFTEARGGAFNYAGHAVSGGGDLNLVGSLSMGDPQFGGPFGLEDPFEAEIHLAVAPHGVLLPELVPDQLRTPIGDPSFWWLTQVPGAQRPIPEPATSVLLSVGFAGLVACTRRSRQA